MCFLAYLKFIFEYFKIFKAKRGNLKIPSWGIGVFWKWKKLTAGLIPIYNGFGHKRCIESRLQITYLADLLIWPIDPTPRFFFKILVAMSGSGQLWSEVKLKHKYITVSKASKSRRPQFSHPFFFFLVMSDLKTVGLKIWKTESRWITFSVSVYCVVYVLFNMWKFWSSGFDALWELVFVFPFSIDDFFFILFW